MITLHVSSLTTFPLDNGIGVLRDAKYAFAEEELNGILEFEMEYDSHGVLVEELKEERIIKAKASDRLGYQLFRIYKIEKSHDADSITVFAQHITYDLAYYFVEELAVNNVSKNQVMEFISQSTSESHPFTLSSPNTSTMSSTSMYRTNPLQMVGGTQGSVLQIWGGQIERDNFNLTMLDRRGSDNGFKVTYEKNITGLNAEFDLSEVYTRFYPFYIREATDESPQEIITIDGKFIDSDLIGGYGFVRIMPLDYSSDERIDQEDSTENIKSKMESIVEQYIEDSKPDLPQVSVEVEFAHLWETEEYKDVIVLEEVGMGDTVYVNHTVLDVEASATVNYIKYDCIAEVNEEVKLGRIKDRTSDSLTEVDGIIDRVEVAESKAQSAVISANGKNTTYESPDMPTGDIKKGDLWFEVIDGDYRRTWRFDGIEWQLMLDMDSQEAKAEAEDAKDRADVAYSEAQEAVGKAQEAVGKAQEGFDKAQDALSSSNIAIGQSAEAFDESRDAFEKAQDAITQADTANTKADQSLSQAQSAFNKAQESLDGLSTLVGITDEQGRELTSIKGSVQGLQASVTDLDDNVASLQMTSQSLAGRLTDAEGNLTSVSATVQGLQTQVSDVEGNVSTVTQLANVLERRMTDSEGNISSLQLTASSLTSRIGLIEDWEIGGRNLLRDTALNHEGLGAWNILPIIHHDELYPYVQQNYGWGVRQIIPLIRAGTYTISTLCKVSGETDAQMRWSMAGAGVNGLKTLNKTTDWQYVSYTFNLDADVENFSIYFLNNNAVGNEQIKMTQFKLEKGNKATDWSPAPEDTDQKFSAIDQTIDSIATRVQTTENNYSSMTQTVQGFQTTIKNVEGDLNRVTNLANANQQSITNVNGKVNTLTQTVDATVSRIENGDTNLISHNPDYWKYGMLNLSTGGDGGDSKMGIKSRHYIPITGGSWYSLSATSEESDFDLGIEYDVHIHWYNSSNSQLRREIVKHGNSKTMQAPSGASKIKLSLRGMRLLGFENEFSLDSLGNIIRVKLQKGKFATEWTEHAGDSYSQYSQLADAINLRVVKGDTITQINLDADKGAYIQGKAIQLDGNVTVHGSFTVGDANIVSLNAGKLTAGILDANKVSIVNLNVNSLVGNMSSFVETAWNGISSQVRITSSGMETFSGGSRTSLLNGSGHNFYRNNLYIGHIGTSSFVGDSNYRGLRFGLENNADFMSWGFAQSASADVYTNMLSWHKTNAKGNKGFTFYDVTTFQEDVAFINTIRTHNSSGYRTLRFVNYDFDGKAGIALLRGRTGGAGLHATTNRVSILAPKSSGNTSSALTVVGGSRGYVSSIEIYNRTYTSNTQLTRVTYNGILGRVSSSRRYKLFEKSINTEYAKRVFGVNAKSWFDKTQAELHANYLTKLENGEECDEDDKAEEELRRIGGVIAEDVHDAGLSMYVNFDDKGRPEGVSHYLWTLLLPIVREHEERLEEQDRKINVLQSMLEELLMKQTTYEER